MAVGNYIVQVRDNRTGEIRQVERHVKPTVGSSTSGNTGASGSGSSGGRSWTGTVIGVQKSGK
jgi:hypothetical protein